MTFGIVKSTGVLSSASVVVMGTLGVTTLHPRGIKSLPLRSR
jgi:hypothetical protein